MNIPTPVYENLTPAERIRAVVSAEARNDHAEILKLRKTCPRKNYSDLDAAFVDPANRLPTIMLAHECELRGLGLSFFAAGRSNDCDTSEAALEGAASIELGLAKFAEVEGFELADLLAMGPPRMSLVIGLAVVAEGNADEEHAAQYAEALAKVFRGESA